MQRYVVAVLIVFILLSGCASTQKKRFTVIADPPDAEIVLVSGRGNIEEKYKSPAEITARLPMKNAFMDRSLVKITRDAYKPREVLLRNIKEGDVLNVKLDKIVHYLLKFRLLSPAKSDELKFRDRTIAVSLGVGEQSFKMGLENLTSSEIKILWNTAEYTDVSNRQHRLMHSGIRYQDRNNILPSQAVPPRGSVQQDVMPVGSVSFSPQKKAYELRPLFTLDNEAAAGLKRQVFYLFIPLEIERQIIPYNFKIEIADTVKE